MAKKRQGKLGRPFLPTDHVKQDSVTVRLQPGEKAAFREAAKRAGMKLSEWIRRALKTALDNNIILM